MVPAAAGAPGRTTAMDTERPSAIPAQEPRVPGPAWWFSQASCCFEAHRPPGERGPEAVAGPGQWHCSSHPEARLSDLPSTYHLKRAQSSPGQDNRQPTSSIKAETLLNLPQWNKRPCISWLCQAISLKHEALSHNCWVPGLLSCHLARAASILRFCLGTCQHTGLS